MFRKLFLLVMVVILVLGFAFVVDAVFYAPHVGASAGGNEPPGMQSLPEAMLQAGFPLAALSNRQDGILFPGASAVEL